MATNEDPIVGFRHINPETALSHKFRLRTSESMSQLDWKLRKIYDETMLINIRINITKTVLLPGVNTTDTMFWFNFQGAYVTNF